MKTLDLLRENPNTNDEIRKYYTELMLKQTESLENSEDSEEFKKFVNDMKVDTYIIANIIDKSPRFLFDFLDLKGLYVSTPIEWENGVPKFRCDIDGSVAEQSFSTRKEAETYVIENAIHVLEGRLISN